MERLHLRDWNGGHLWWHWSGKSRGGVDGNFSTSVTDDRVLCQTVSGFIPGASYVLEFDATRRGNGAPDPVVSVTATVDDGCLSKIILRSGVWNLQREHLQFIATRASHTFTVTPNFTNSYGMLIDNLAIVRVITLPMELLYFTARSVADVVHTAWSTASEQNTDHFDVERSTDLMAWAFIGEVAAAGNSQQRLNYQMEDVEPSEGISYYRLNEVDRDGTVQSSPIEVVERQSHATLFVWPNPAENTISISGVGSPSGYLRLLNAQGQEIAATRSLNGGAYHMDISGLPSGIYRVLDRDRSGGFVKE